MKPIFYIGFLVILSVCVANLDAKTQKAMDATDGIISNALPIELPTGSQTSGLRPLALVQESSEPLPPPIANDLVWHFTYLRPMTNCFLLSSTDLVHWDYRYDFTLETNADGSVGWHLPPDPDAPAQFYRIGGEPFP